jgi:hypothetical protein
MTVLGGDFLHTKGMGLGPIFECRIMSNTLLALMDITLDLKPAQNLRELERQHLLPIP